MYVVDNTVCFHFVYITILLMGQFQRLKLMRINVFKIETPLPFSKSNNLSRGAR